MINSVTVQTHLRGKHLSVPWQWNYGLFTFENLKFDFLENQKPKSQVGLTIPYPASKIDDDEAKLIVIYN